MDIKQKIDEIIKKVRTKDLHKKGISIDSDSHPQNIPTESAVTCSLCGKKVNKNDAIPNACFTYCIDCANKHSISEHSGIKHIIHLFTVKEVSYEYSESVCIETISGRPCYEFSRCIQRGCGWGGTDHYREITYERIKEIAEKTSQELYEKYKDINETNWKEYI